MPKRVILRYVVPQIIWIDNIDLELWDLSQYIQNSSLKAPADYSG